MTMDQSGISETHPPQDGIPLCFPLQNKTKQKNNQHLVAEMHPQIC